MSGRKALVIGIDDYPHNELSCCVNDALAISDLLKNNHDGTPNFNVKTPSIDTASEMREEVERLFDNSYDVALFYFSGHGARSKSGTYLLAPDYVKDRCGLTMNELMQVISSSKNRNNVILLDCCYAGKMGDSLFGDDICLLKSGTTIMSACKNHECAMEGNKHGIFTELIIAGLRGGAADLTGCVTPSSLYAYVDKALGPWEQRPVFKTNVSNFVSLRNVIPQIDRGTIVEIANLFDGEDSILQLDPSFEFTNNPEYKHETIKPYSVKENVSKMKLLQKMASVGLVTPIGEEHMYFVAMKSGKCKLTPIGKYYWNLVKEGRI
jgi:hypothetical protein